ncbi:MAG TPA: serine protease, partial [Methylobacterium sp.]
MKTPEVAPERVAPQSKAQVQLSFAPVVKRAAPSVVNVYASQVEKRGPSRSAMEEFMRRFFGEDGAGRGRGGAPGERAQRSLGSGVVVDASGLVITNNHVIE